MDRKNIAMLFITIVVFFLLFHILPFLSYQRSKQAYGLYKDGKNNEAITVWKKNNDLYNAGTVTAREAIRDGYNTTGLNQALELLTQAQLIHNNDKKIEHNKAVVEQLLQDNTSSKQQKQGSDDQQQQGTEQGSGTQKEESGSKSNNQQSDAAKEPGEQEGGQQQSSLTQEEQQALDAYQQSLEQQQAQNQQFFGKEQQAQNPNDAFGMLEQFFGQDPKLQQQIGGNNGEKDW